MKLKSAALSKQGGREYNQDAVSISNNGKAYCFTVCDGLGSYFGSEVASEIASGAVKRFFESSAFHNRVPKPEELATAIFTAHGEIHKAKEKRARIASGCTTIAIVCTDLTETVFAHIGDTRIYYFSGGEIIYQSLDHSLAEFAVQNGQIKREEIRTHKDQNKLTRVLGSDYYIAPDIFESSCALRAGDRFLICTDGLWEYVVESEMALLLALPAPEAALAEMEKLILSRAPKNHDNYSAIVVYIEG